MSKVDVSGEDILITIKSNLTPISSQSVDPYNPTLERWERLKS